MIGVRKRWYTRHGHRLSFFEKSEDVWLNPGMTKQLHFTPEIQEALNHERYHHLSPLVQKRMETLWLKSHELPHWQIAQLAGVCENTMRSYFALYEEGGIEKLKEITVYRPESQLAEHATTLEAYFQANPPAGIKEAQKEIAELTGLQRSETQVGKFLHKLGLKPRKVGMIPAKVDVEKQADYLKNELEPRLAEAKEGKRAVFFVDAAHFVLAPYLGWLWSFARIFIAAPAGRQRFNVLGALNATTHQLVTIMNDTTINADAVCLLLQKLADLSLGIPITLILDNARYQHCAHVIEAARQLQIELCFLPPYSPNLNLIERLWKFVKKKCLYSIYYSNFADFKAAISTCLAQTQTTYKEDLDSLLTLKS
jgi:transposase